MTKPTRRNPAGLLRRKPAGLFRRNPAGLLRLYPVGYRDAYGPEILDVHRELTTDLPLPARLRADADLIAHALRVRLRLDSASPGGRFFALTTPFALAVSAAYAGIQLMRWYAGIALSPGSTRSHLATIDAPQAVNILLLALITTGAILTLTRRWPPGRFLTTTALLAYATQWTATPSLYGNGPSEALAAALTAATILTCPPDLASPSDDWPAHASSRSGPGVAASGGSRPGLAASGGSGRGRVGGRGVGGRQVAVTAGGMAAIAWFPVALVETRGFVVSTDYGAWPLLALGLTGVALALYARPTGLRLLAATAAASPLFVAHAYVTGVLEIVR